MQSENRLISLWDDYSEGTQWHNRGQEKGSRLVLAFSGPARSPGPTSVGL